MTNQDIEGCSSLQCIIRVVDRRIHNEHLTVGQHMRFIADIFEKRAGHHIVDLIKIVIVIQTGRYL